MEIETFKIDGLKLITPDVYHDDRGCFFETFNKEKFNNMFPSHKDAIYYNFVQDNHSISHKNVIRGLHYQNEPFGQGKLVRVLNGVVMDVVVDLREGSPTFGQHESVFLSGGNRKIFFIPAGFAHGFKSMSDNTHFAYKCTNIYNKESEGGLLYNDKDLNINWGESEVIVSEKDLLLPKFRDIYPLDDKDSKK